MNESKTLLIKHLPSDLTANQKEDLLNAFGAVNVNVMRNNGKMKHCAFATFQTHEIAEKVLLKLHNLNVLDSRITAEFARNKSFKKVCNKEKKNLNEENQKEEKFVSKKCRVCKRLPSIAPCFGLEYPMNPGLKYKYPSPNGDILINICSALLTVPKFYTQVLHLMNKMNLFPPFNHAVNIPSVLVETIKQKVPSRKLNRDLSEDESEIESDSSSKSKQINLPVPDRIKSLKRKMENLDETKIKFQKFSKIQSFNQDIKSTSNISTKEVFEEVNLFKPQLNLQIPSEIDFKDQIIKTSEVNLFGKIDISEDKSAEVNKSPVDEDKDRKFISEKLLEEGRLTNHDMEEHDLFKNYSPGVPTTRLYIKNLKKNVTEKELEHIFGSFINFQNEDETKSFYCRVMKHGRMKGQAFIGLPTVDVAKKALNATNGFQLKDRPMIVSFARSKS